MSWVGAVEAFNTFLVSQQPGSALGWCFMSYTNRRAVGSWLEWGDAPVQGRGARMLGNTIFNIFLLLCILWRLTCPRCCCIWAGAHEQCPSPVPHGTAGDHCRRAHRGQGEHPTVLQASLGLFPLEKGKSGKKPKRECAAVQRGSVSRAARRTAVLAPLLGYCQVPAPPQPCVPCGTALTQQSTAGTGDWDSLPPRPFAVRWVPLEEGRRAHSGLVIAIDGGDGCGSLLVGV